MRESEAPLSDPINVWTRDSWMQQTHADRSRRCCPLGLRALVNMVGRRGHAAARDVNEANLARGQGRGQRE